MKKERNNWWVSTEGFATALVVTDGNMVIKEGTAPIFQKFIGQKFQHLLRWLQRRGNTDVRPITTSPEIIFHQDSCKTEKKENEKEN